MGDDESSQTWTAKHLTQKENAWLCHIDKSFVEDAFNLYGLKALVPRYKEALDVILGKSFSQSESIDSSTRLLYGLMHQRYILTSNGLEKMNIKYINGDFGCCPRYLCRKQHVIPVSHPFPPNPTELNNSHSQPCRTPVPYMKQLSNYDICLG